MGNSLDIRVNLVQRWPRENLSAIWFSNRNIYKKEKTKVENLQEDRV